MMQIRSVKVRYSDAYRQTLLYSVIISTHTRARARTHAHIEGVSQNNGNTFKKYLTDGRAVNFQVQMLHKYTNFYC